jgi:excisionase family DNA binding protein
MSANKKVVEVPTCPVPPRGFRIAEAAAYMGVSPWFVEQEVRAGRLPALKLCRHYTLLKEDLDAYLDAATKAASWAEAPAVAGYLGRKTTTRLM